MLETLRKKIVTTIASRHVAGPELGDALPVCRWAHEKGFRSILSPWARPGETAAQMFERYRDAFDALGSEPLECYVSMKLESIGFDFGLFEDLIEVAKSKNVRLHVDSLGPDSAVYTFRFLEKAAVRYKDLGCTLPSRWRRSLDDAERAVDLGLSARIVKGQWEDPYDHGIDPRKNYLAIASVLAGRARHVGTATHDISLAEKALTILLAQNTYCEMEQLATLPLGGMRLAKKLGCPYRIYVAYGYPGVPYNTRFVLSRPGMVTWVLADFALDMKKPWSQAKL